ncbi:MAG: glycosyltransferase, partial [Candidatus Omnitrophica bacterium]|nr:glycosyltransferase [Candidatus Omnitrophota bacterium]
SALTIEDIKITILDNSAELVNTAKRVKNILLRAKLEWDDGVKKNIIKDWSKAEGDKIRENLIWQHLVTTGIIVTTGVLGGPVLAFVAFFAAYMIRKSFREAVKLILAAAISTFVIGVAGIITAVSVNLPLRLGLKIRLLYEGRINRKIAIAGWSIGIVGAGFAVVKYLVPFLFASMSWWLALPITAAAIVAIIYFFSGLFTPARKTAEWREKIHSVVPDSLGSNQSIKDIIQEQKESQKALDQFVELPNGGELSSNRGVFSLPNEKPVTKLSRDILAEYGIYDISATEELAGGIGSKYKPLRITSSQATMVLRRIDKPLEQIRFITSVMNRLRNKGLPVPKLYKKLTGEEKGADDYIVKNEAGYWILEEYMEKGHVVRVKDAQPKHLKQISGLAARINNALNNFTPEGEKYYKSREEIFVDVEKGLIEFNDSLEQLPIQDLTAEQKLFMSNFDFFMKQAEIFRSNYTEELRSKLIPSIIHNDLHCGNVKFDGDGKLVAVLDFHVVQSDLRIVEFNNLILGRDTMAAPIPYSQDKLILMLETYQESVERKLSSEEIGAIIEVLRLRFLEEIHGRFVRHHAFVPMNIFDYPEQTPYATSSIETFKKFADDFKDNKLTSNHHLKIKLFDKSVAGEIDMIAKGIRRADIVVGIPCYDEAQNIRSLIAKVQEGLMAHYPDKESIIAVIGEQKKPGTVNAAREMDGNSGVPVVGFTKESIFAGAEGKKWSERAFFKIARQLGAEVYMQLDADLTITPDWVKLFMKPISEGKADYVSPDYQIRYYDSDDKSVTDHLMFPLIASLYGQRVRHAGAGGEFAVKASLLDEYLEEEGIWLTKDTPFEPNFLATAIKDGKRQKEISVREKLHKPLSIDAVIERFPIYTTAIFDQILRHMDYIEPRLQNEDIESIGIHGPPLSDIQAREIVNIDYKEWIEQYKLDYEIHRDFYEQKFPSTFPLLERLYKSEPTEFSLPSQEWARIVFTFLKAYRDPDLKERKEILETLKPVFQARVATFAREVENLTYSQMERELDEQLMDFVQAKRLLIEKVKKEKSIIKRMLSILDRSIFLGLLPVTEKLASIFEEIKNYVEDHKIILVMIGVIWSYFIFKSFFKTFVRYSQGLLLKPNEAEVLKKDYEVFKKNRAMLEGDFLKLLKVHLEVPTWGRFLEKITFRRNKKHYIEDCQGSLTLTHPMFIFGDRGIQGFVIRNLFVYPRFVERVMLLYNIWPGLAEEILDNIVTHEQGHLDNYVRMVRQQWSSREIFAYYGNKDEKDAYDYMLREKGKMAIALVSYWFQPFLHPSYLLEEHTREYFRSFCKFPYLEQDEEILDYVMNIEEGYIEREREFLSSNSNMLSFFVSFSLLGPVISGGLFIAAWVIKIFSGRREKDSNPGKDDAGALGSNDKLKDNQSITAIPSKRKTLLRVRSFDEFIELLYSLRKAISAGDLGDVVVAYNIKEMVKNMREVYDLSDERLKERFGGNIEIVRNVEKPYERRNELPAAMGIIEQFLKQKQGLYWQKPIFMITDGGFNTRAGIGTLRAGYQGQVKLAGQIEDFRELQVMVLAAILNQIPDGPQRFLAWGASDNFTFFGRATVGEHLLSELPGHILHQAGVFATGAKTRLLAEQQIEQLQKNDAQGRLPQVVSEMGGWTAIMDNSDKLQKLNKEFGIDFSEIEKILEDEQIRDLGVLAADEKGRLSWFGQKVKDAVTLILASYKNGGFLYKNAFLEIVGKELMKMIYQRLSAIKSVDVSRSEDGNLIVGTLDRLPVSFMESVIQSRLMSDEEWLAWEHNVKDQDWLAVKKAIDEVFEELEKEVYVIDMGEGYLWKDAGNLRMTKEVFALLGKIAREGSDTERGKARLALGLPSAASIDEDTTWIDPHLKVDISENAFVEKSIFEGEGQVIIEQGAVLSRVWLDIPEKTTVKITADSQVFFFDQRGVHVEFKGEGGVINGYFSEVGSKLTLHSDEQVGGLRVQAADNTWRFVAPHQLILSPYKEKTLEDLYKTEERWKKLQEEYPYLEQYKRWAEIKDKQFIELHDENLAGHNFSEAQKNTDYLWMAKWLDEFEKEILNEVKRRKNQQDIPKKMPSNAVLRSVKLQRNPLQSFFIKLKKKTVTVLKSKIFLTALLFLSLSTVGLSDEPSSIAGVFDIETLKFLFEAFLGGLMLTSNDCFSLFGAVTIAITTTVSLLGHFISGKIAYMKKHKYLRWFSTGLLAGFLASALRMGLPLGGAVIFSQIGQFLAIFMVFGLTGGIGGLVIAKYAKGIYPKIGGIIGISLGVINHLVISQGWSTQRPLAGIILALGEFLSPAIGAYIVLKIFAWQDRYIKNIKKHLGTDALGSNNELKDNMIQRKQGSEILDRFASLLKGEELPSNPGIFSLPDEKTLTKVSGEVAANGVRAGPDEEIKTASLQNTPAIGSNSFLKKVRFFLLKPIFTIFDMLPPVIGMALFILVITLPPAILGIYVRKKMDAQLRHQARIEQELKARLSHIKTPAAASRKYLELIQEIDKSRFVGKDVYIHNTKIARDIVANLHLPTLLDNKEGHTGNLLVSYARAHSREVIDEDFSGLVFLDDSKVAVIGNRHEADAYTLIPLIGYKIHDHKDIGGLPGLLLENIVIESIFGNIVDIFVYYEGYNFSAVTPQGLVQLYGDNNRVIGALSVQELKRIAEENVDLDEKLPSNPGIFSLQDGDTLTKGFEGQLIGVKGNYFPLSIKAYYKAVKDVFLAKKIEIRSQMGRKSDSRLKRYINDLYNRIEFPLKEFIWKLNSFLHKIWLKFSGPGIGRSIGIKLGYFSFAFSKASSPVKISPPQTTMHWWEYFSTNFSKFSWTNKSLSEYFILAPFPDSVSITSLFKNVNYSLHHSLHYSAIGSNSLLDEKIGLSLNFMRTIKKPAKAALVMPMYGDVDEEGLRETVWQLDELVRASGGNFSWQLICVDDGSPDRGFASRVREIASSFASLTPRNDKGEVFGASNDKGDDSIKVLTITPEEKQGRKGGAVHLGFEEALKGDAGYIGYIDVDSFESIDNRQLGLLAEPLYKDEADVAIGSRWAKGGVTKNMSLGGVLSSRMYNWFVRFMLSPVRDIRDTQRGFKLFKRDVVKHILPFVEDKSLSFDTELLVLARLAGYRVSEAGIHWHEFGGRTFNTFLESIRMARNVALKQTRHLGNKRILTQTLASNQSECDLLNTKESLRKLLGTYNLDIDEDALNLLAGKMLDEPAVYSKEIVQEAARIVVSRAQDKKRRITLKNARNMTTEIEWSLVLGEFNEIKAKPGVKQSYFTLSRNIKDIKNLCSKLGVNAEWHKHFNYYSSRVLDYLENSKLDFEHYKGHIAPLYRKLVLDNDAGLIMASRIVRNMIRHDASGYTGDSIEILVCSAIFMEIKELIGSEDKDAIFSARVRHILSGEGKNKEFIDKVITVVKGDKNSGTHEDLLIKILSEAATSIKPNRFEKIRKIFELTQETRPFTRMLAISAIIAGLFIIAPYFTIGISISSVLISFLQSYRRRILTDTQKLKFFLIDLKQKKESDLHLREVLTGAPHRI